VTIYIYIQTFSELFRFLSTLSFKPTNIAEYGRHKKVRRGRTQGILLYTQVDIYIYSINYKRYVSMGTVCKFFETNNIDSIVQTTARQCI